MLWKFRIFHHREYRGPQRQSPERRRGSYCANREIDDPSRAGIDNADDAELGVAMRKIGSGVGGAGEGLAEEEVGSGVRAY
jgi:hypothetical protein